MKVQIGTDTYKIDWKHKIGDPFLVIPVGPEPSKEDRVYRGITTCQVSCGSYGATGTAYCAKDEKNYVKAIGRRLSMIRAIKGLSKEVRHEIRHTYYLEHEMGYPTAQETIRRINDPAFDYRPRHPQAGNAPGAAVVTEPGNQKI